MIKIKAKKNCKWCGGTGYAVSFISLSGNKEICPCIKEQIKIVPNE